MTDVQPRTDAEIQTDRPGTASTRRVVLMGAGAIGATAVLTACGTDASGTNPNGSDFAAEPAPAGSEGADTGSTGGGSTGTVLVAASEVAVGGGVILDELVVTQPAEGTYKAFSNICTHQGCKVAEVVDGTINCKCHGAKFSIEDGSPTSGPAKTALEATEVQVDGDNIVTV